MNEKVSSRIRIPFWPVVAGLAAILVLAFAINGWIQTRKAGSIHESAAQPVAPVTAAERKDVSPAGAVESYREASTIAARDDTVLRLHEREVAQEQGRRLEAEWLENQALPKEDRSPLAPKVSTVLAVQSGEMLLQ